MQATIEQPGTGLNLSQLRRIMLRRQYQGFTRAEARKQVEIALANAIADRDEIDTEIENMRRYLERTRI